MLQEYLNWWMKQQQYALYPRSVQAENNLVVGWLLYLTRNINCVSLQRALEKRFDGKFEVGCRYRMISFGTRGQVPKEQQVKAMHIECDSEVQFDLKAELSKIYASEKNKACPNGLRMLLVPDFPGYPPKCHSYTCSTRQLSEADYGSYILGYFST